MISADDHLYLQYLPTDLWVARLPASLRDRAPRVEHRDVTLTVERQQRHRHVVSLERRS